MPWRTITAGMIAAVAGGSIQAQQDVATPSSPAPVAQLQAVEVTANGATQVSAYALHYTLKLFSNFTYFMDHPSTGDQFSQQDSRDVYGLSASRSLDHTVGAYRAFTEFDWPAPNAAI